MLTYFWIGLGSALGGMARFACSNLAVAWFGPTFPWGTLAINVLGSFVIGFFATLTGDEATGIPAEILSISTFSEKGLLRKTHVVRAVAVPHVGPAAEKLLASAALKVSVLQMDTRAEKSRSKKRWFRPE